MADLIELYPGMRGFFVPGDFQTKANDASKTPRQKFMRVTPDGQIGDSYYIDPKGKFTNMLGGSDIYDFIKDPDTFNPANPSGFAPEEFKLLQQFANDPMGLIEHARKNPNLGIWKQKTVPVQPMIPYAPATGGIRG